MLLQRRLVKLIKMLAPHTISSSHPTWFLTLLNVSFDINTYLPSTKDSLAFMSSLLHPIPFSGHNSYVTLLTSLYRAPDSLNQHSNRWGRSTCLSIQHRDRHIIRLCHAKNPLYSFTRASLIFVKGRGPRDGEGATIPFRQDFKLIRVRFHAFYASSRYLQL